jgi:hypothetical protein
MQDVITRERTDGQAIRWEVAKTKYELAQDEFDRLWQLHYDAEESLPERVDFYFDELKLGIGMRRDDARRAIITALSIQTFGNNGGPKPGTDAYEAKLVEIADEANRIAAEFMAYQEDIQAERTRLRVEELRQDAIEYGEAHYFPARHALMQTPAPDFAALLVKMGIAARWADEPFVDSALADAKRLLETA